MKRLFDRFFEVKQGEDPEDRSKGQNLHFSPDW